MWATKKRDNSLGVGWEVEFGEWVRCDKALEVLSGSNDRTEAMAKFGMHGRFGPPLEGLG